KKVIILTKHPCFKHSSPVKGGGISIYIHPIKRPSISFFSNFPTLGIEIPKLFKSQFDFPLPPNFFAHLVLTRGYGKRTRPRSELRNPRPFPDHIQIKENIGISGIVLIQRFHIIEQDLRITKHHIRTSYILTCPRVAVGMHVFPDKV